MLHKLTFDREVLLATLDHMVQPHTIAYNEAWINKTPAADAWSAMETYITAAYYLMERYRAHTNYVKGGKLCKRNTSGSPTNKELLYYTSAPVRSV